MAIASSGNSDGKNFASTSSQASSEDKKGANDMIGGCSVCSDDQGTDENPLVYCDGCEVAVHQACYGIVDVPPGNWFCRKCEFGESQGKIKCELCPSQEGALKKTETGLWAHVVCALYIPEVRFGNNNTMEPIEIKHIQADRYNKICYLCEEVGDSSTAAYGAVMDCYKLGCKQSFHVTCAQSAGLLCEEAGHGLDNVIYCGYCKHHFRKMKAGHRKAGNTLNNLNSSYSDSASDSSQDNDSRFNAPERDKNSARTLNTATNQSNNDTIASNNSELAVPSAISMKTNLPSNNSAISLTIPVNSSGCSNKTATTNTNAPPKEKKKRTPKTTQAPPNAVSLSSHSVHHTGSSCPNTEACERLEPTATRDIYSWPNSSKDQTEKSSAKGSKKKSSLNSHRPNARSTPLNNPSGYNLYKTGSPNLSSSTSPSLSSPSNSTKSTSSTSSVSTTTASSSSSTSSNSPSPALLSPNVSIRGPAARLESPLASNPRRGNNSHNKSFSDLTTNDTTLPTEQSHLQAFPNFSVLRTDPKKNLTASSSLLSTAVPILTGSSANPESTNLIPVDGNTNHTSPNGGHNQVSGDETFKSLAEDPSTNFPSKLGSLKNTHPIVPPLIIPVSVNDSSTSNSKTAAKPRTTTTKSARKKSTESTVGPKPEPKQKTNKTKKAQSSSEGPSAPKQEAKRGKNKAPKIANSTVAPHTPESALKTSAKRKSRSTTNDSGVAPSPNKRSRKKKTVQAPTEPANDKPSVPCSKPSENHQVASGNASIGTSPLMVNTPVISNRLLQGMGTVENRDLANRYFSPILSPYSSYDHSSIPSLSRSSLSRLFTSSSIDNGQGGQFEDLGKAFEELRDNVWSHLSKYVLEQAQQFDIPSLIGTLYTLRTENEKLVSKVRDLTTKRDQLVAMNARLDLPGNVLAQHLSSTNPHFSSVVNGITNSSRMMPTPSPSSVINKQPLVSISSYNHVPTSSFGPTGYLDRSSPIVGQTHSNMKSSTISTPSPPVNSLVAHGSNTSRPGIIAANQTYMSNVVTPMSTLTPLGSNVLGPPYYSRQ